MKKQFFTSFLYSLIVLSVISTLFLFLEVDVMQIAFGGSLENYYDTSASFAQKDSFTKLLIDVLINIFKL